MLDPPRRIELKRSQADFRRPSVDVPALSFAGAGLFREVNDLRLPMKDLRFFWEDEHPGEAGVVDESDI